MQWLLAGGAFPLWSVAPFAAMLLCIALLPLVAGRFWEHNRNKAALSLVLGVPVAAWTAFLDKPALVHAGAEYLAFVILLGALFVIASGIVVRGTLSGTPRLNTGVLAIGALLASRDRHHRRLHAAGPAALARQRGARAQRARFVFFIFVVSNVGGLLTPLGDPPLFLGFLRGVPFSWTLRLWPQWLVANAVLLVVFFVVDSDALRREDRLRPRPARSTARRRTSRLVHLPGGLNFLFLAG